MQHDEAKRRRKIRQMAARYNMLVNFFWTGLSIFPVWLFCYRHVPLNLVYIMLAASLLMVLLPNSFFDTIQLAKSTAFYKRLGVDVVNRFAQNGGLINALVRKRFPEYTTVTAKKADVKRLLQQTYIFEKFHFLAFIFFGCITVYAVTKHLFNWAFLLTVLNIVYNVYPNFLQQYIRLKLRMYRRR